MNLWSHLDREVAEDVSRFWETVIHGFDYRAGLVSEFKSTNPAIRADTEYFGPNVTMDDRLRYIANHLSTNEAISDKNRVLNFVITHFYGGRDCHRVINAELDPNKAFTDFERVLKDEEYLAEIVSNIDKARSLGYSIWSKTELHTSLQSAANRYVAEKYNRESHASNMILWLAGWIENGIVDRVLESRSLKECVEILTSIDGVGPYYGYHGATDQSTNPKLEFHHDEPFVLPGPGCKRTLKMLFPNLSTRECGEGLQVVWLREHQEEVFGKISFDEHWHNVVVDGKRVYKSDQKELTCYASEVALCQYGIYRDLLADPKKVDKRRIYRPDVTKIVADMKSEPKTLEDFFS